MQRALFAVTLLASACEAITHFDVQRTAETSDALCSDGIDNDGDGLTDCQDWTCLGRPVCCNMPIVVLQDDFEAPGCAQAPCSAPSTTCQPDPARWATWGLPLPIECDGGFSPHKAEACYDVGIVSMQSLHMHPGLSVIAHLQHAPESNGRLSVGLTLQQQIGSGVTDCSPFDPPPLVAALRQTPTAGGWTLDASFDQDAAGTSPAVTDDDVHEIRIDVATDRRAHYSLDGVEFAASPMSEPLPDNPPAAFLVIAGRGERAQVTDVRVIDGTQCEAPAEWHATDPAVALDAEPTLHGWDSVSVYAPAVWESASGAQMYFTGCDQDINSGCSTLGIGRAQSSDGVVFTRDPANPRFSGRRVALDVATLRGDDTFNGTVRGYLTTNVNAAQQSLMIELVTDDDTNRMAEGNPALRTGAPGAWDDADVCCASAVLRDGRVYLWYAGHSTADPTWRIGLALSLDGVTFTKVASNPVLAGGSGDAFDAHGVTEPEVFYDPARSLYRMWYTAEAFFGVTSIGYAVSADGLHWSKYPSNPVLTLDGAGLAGFGSPAVHSEEGRLRMWLAGKEAGRVGQRIYGFSNAGLPPMP